VNVTASLHQQRTPLSSTLVMAWMPWRHNVDLLVTAGTSTQLDWIQSQQLNALHSTTHQLAIANQIQEHVTVDSPRGWLMPWHDHAPTSFAGRWLACVNWWSWAQCSKLLRMDNALVAGYFKVREYSLVLRPWSKLPVSYGATQVLCEEGTRTKCNDM
jgi:hypothetical protein